MVRIDDFFGNYLKTEDINEEIDVTIKEVKVEKVGREENADEKIVVYFDKFEKGLILNKVNGEALAEEADSRETEKWIGVKVCLYVDPNVLFGGKRVGGIRVKKVPVEKKDHTSS